MCCSAPIQKGDFHFIQRIGHNVPNVHRVARGIYKVRHGIRGDAVAPAVGISCRVLCESTGVSAVSTVPASWPSGNVFAVLPLDGDVSINLSFTVVTELGYVSFEKIGDF